MASAVACSASKMSPSAIAMAHLADQDEYMLGTALEAVGGQGYVTRRSQCVQRSKQDSAL